MPQEGLNVPEADSFFQQVGSEAVAQGVYRSVFPDTCVLAGLPEDVLDTAGAVFAAVRSLKQPVLRGVLLVVRS